MASGYYVLNGWAGTTKHSIEIVGETPKKYRCKLLQDAPLAGRNRWGKAGDVVLIPKTAVRLDVGSR